MDRGPGTNFGSAHYGRIRSAGDRPLEYVAVSSHRHLPADVCSIHDRSFWLAAVRNRDTIQARFDRECSRARPSHVYSGI